MRGDRRAAGVRILKALNRAPQGLTRAELIDRAGLPVDINGVDFHYVMGAAREILRKDRTGLPRDQKRMIPRPVGHDGFRYRITAEWNRVDESDPDVRNGALARLGDEITRDRTTLEHYEVSSSRYDGRSRLGRLLRQTADQQRGIIATKEILFDLLSDGVEA